MSPGGVREGEMGLPRCRPGHNRTPACQERAGRGSEHWRGAGTIRARGSRIRGLIKPATVGDSGSVPQGSSREAACAGGSLTCRVVRPGLAGPTRLRGAAPRQGRAGRAAWPSRGLGAFRAQLGSFRRGRDETTGAAGRKHSGPAGTRDRGSGRRRESESGRGRGGGAVATGQRETGTGGGGRRRAGGNRSLPTAGSGSRLRPAGGCAAPAVLRPAGPSLSPALATAPRAGPGTLKGLETGQDLPRSLSGA